MFDWSCFTEDMDEQTKIELLRQFIEQQRKKEADSYGVVGSYIYRKLQPHFSPDYHFVEADPNENRILDSPETCMFLSRKFLNRIWKQARNCQYITAMEEAMVYYQDLLQQVLEPFIQHSSASTDMELKWWTQTMEQELQSFSNDFRRICSQKAQKAEWDRTGLCKPEFYRTAVSIEKLPNGKYRYTGTGVAAERMEKDVNQSLFTLFGIFKAVFREYVRELSQSCINLPPDSFSISFDEN